MDTKTNILQTFKSCLVQFLDELITQFPEEADLIVFRILVKDKIAIDDVIKVISHTLTKNDNELKNMINQRNEKFFLEHDFLSGIVDADKEKINKFKKLWRSQRLDSDDKEAVWNWLDNFVIICDRYLKL